MHYFSSKIAKIAQRWGFCPQTPLLLVSRGFAPRNPCLWQLGVCPQAPIASGRLGAHLQTPHCEMLVTPLS